jgi:hypothetical protein
MGVRFVWVRVRYGLSLSSAVSSLGVWEEVLSSLVAIVLYTLLRYLASAMVAQLDGSLLGVYDIMNHSGWRSLHFSL